MSPTSLNRSKELKQALLDFIFESEGEVATALEVFSKDQLRKWAPFQHSGMSQSAMAVDMFLTEGTVGKQTPIEYFIHAEPTLSPSDRQLLSQWNNSFNGLFEVIDCLPEGYLLMNWLTAKQYQVFVNGLQDETKVSRLKPGEIILTRISPLTEREWLFSGPMDLLGKLGKPKLAVAIGNFKDRFKHHLYGDAADLLEEAWQSVEQYYQAFLEFFGAARITLPGQVLNQRLQDFQDIIIEKHLASAGIDSSKSMKDLATEAGISSEEMQEVANRVGASDPLAQQLLDSQKSIQMIMPRVELPKPLQRAEQVTVWVHPRWGQCFLMDYPQLETLLDSSPEVADRETLDTLVRRYLEDLTVYPDIWYQLAQEHSAALEASLRRILAQPDFQIERDLEQALVASGHTMEPELPETASVPLHLNDLFQEALADLNKSKSKSKVKHKSKAGFGRPT